MNPTTILLTKELSERCAELAEAHKKELVELRTKRRNPQGKQSMMSEFVRQALTYYVQKVEQAGHIL